MGNGAPHHERRVLVTGAFGNVGQELVSFLAERGDRVHAVDLSNARTRRVAARLHRRHEFQRHSVDLTDRAAVAGLVREVDPDVVVHLAALLPPLTEADPVRTERVNVDATRHLLDACKAIGGRARFVHASTYAIYGPRNGDKPLPLIDATTPPSPAETYGRTKLAAEEAVRSSGLPWVVLRLGGVVPFEAKSFDPAIVRLLFEVPFRNRRHGLDPRDAARAFGEAATRDVIGRVLLVAGGDAWKLRHGEFSNRYLAAQGLLPVPEEAFCPGHPERDEPWFVEDHMDTREAEALLDFQRTGPDAYFAEVARRHRRQRALLRPVARVVRKAILSLSPYHRAPRDRRIAPIETRLRSMLRASDDGRSITVLGSIEAEGSTASVAAAIAQGDSWSRWSEVLASLEPVEGPSARLSIRAPFDTTFELPVTVMASRPLSLLRWRGGVRGLFEGEHSIAVRESGPGMVVIENRERFTGTLGRPVGRFIRPFLDAIYERDCARLAACAREGTGHRPARRLAAARSK
jgi:D-erythronate 2-dehydrogenase